MAELIWKDVEKSYNKAKNETFGNVHNLKVYKAMFDQYLRSGLYVNSCQVIDNKYYELRYK